MANTGEQPAQTVEYNPSTDSYEPVASAPLEDTAPRASAPPPSSPSGRDSSSSKHEPPPAPPMPPSPGMPQSTPDTPQQHQEEIAARGSTPAAVEGTAPLSGASNDNVAPSSDPLPAEGVPAVKLLPTSPDAASPSATPQDAQQPESSRDWAKEAIAAIAEAEEVTGDHPTLDQVPPGPPVAVKESAPLLPEVSKELVDVAFVTVDSVPADDASPPGASSPSKRSGTGDTGKRDTADELDDIIAGRSAAAPPQPTVAPGADDAADAAAEDLDEANKQLANKLDAEIVATDAADAVAAEIVADAIMEQAAQEAVQEVAAEAADAADGDLVVVDVTPGSEPTAEVLVPEDAPLKGTDEDTGVTLVDATVAQATLEPEDSDESNADVTVLDATIVQAPADDDDSNDVSLTHVTAAVIEPEGADPEAGPSDVVIVEETVVIGPDDAAEGAPADEVAIVGSPTLKGDPAAAAAAGIVAVEVAAADDPSDASDLRGNDAPDARDGANKAGSAPTKPSNAEGATRAMGVPPPSSNTPQDGAPNDNHEDGVVASVFMAILQQIISLIKWLLSLVTSPRETSEQVPSQRSAETVKR